MKYFLVIGFLFLAGAIYNLYKGDYPNMFVGLALATFLFLIYFSRKRRAAQDVKVVQTFAAQDVGASQCCKCGSRLDVKLRAYLLTYSVIFYSSKSPGAFKPICDGCSIIAGLPYSFLLSFLDGGVSHMGQFIQFNQYIGISKAVLSLPIQKLTANLNVKCR